MNEATQKALFGALFNGNLTTPETFGSAQSERGKENTKMLFEHANKKGWYGMMKTERIQQEQKYLQRR